MSKCVDNQAHYSATAPEIVTYEYFDGYMGAPEYWACWVEVLAVNAKDAIKQAVKHEDFKEWVDEARSDGVNPYKGVKAKRFLCPHGTCMGCVEECAQCLEDTPNA